MLTIFYSNKVEVLSAQLVDCLIKKPLPPLVSENILLESPAMSHWLTKQIADQTGIAANIEYPFPAALVWDIYRRLMPELPERSSFDRLSLSLRIYSLFTALGECRQEQAKESLSASVSALQSSMSSSSFTAFKTSSLGDYCRTVDNPKDLYVLANHVAGLFDQYQIYRPDWLQCWALDQSLPFNALLKDLAQWQKELWQWLTGLDNQQDDPSRAEIFDKAVHSLGEMIACDPNAENMIFADLPRLHCFALSNLPSSYLLLIEKLSHWVEIIIYALNPSVHFWQYALSQRQLLEQAALQQGDNVDNVNSTAELDLLLDYSNTNELLVQLARQHKAYLSQLLALKVDETRECFIELNNDSLLERCQNSVTKLEQYPDKQVLDKLDDSIEIHSCHNRLREVEVLQQKILQVLDENPDWRQGDIAIIVPDVDSYAPYFHAVFASASTTATPHALLHYAVSEKNSVQQNSLSSALTKLLALMQSSFTHSEVLSFLSEPCTHQYFGFQQEQLKDIEQLLLQCNVRFGLEPNTAASSAIVDVSFSQAKARLLASFYKAEAVNGIDDMLSPLLPHIEHDRAKMVGQLCEFIDQLIDCKKRFQALSLNASESTNSLKSSGHSLEHWLNTLLSCAKNTLLLDGDFEEQATQVLNSLQKIEAQADLSQFKTEQGELFSPKIDFSVFSVLVNDSLSASGQNFYYSETAINIASFLPMQSVPFKMIAVLGMNDGEFPVITPTDQLDLMVHQARLGDRNKIDEQRGQFLQALLSCREKFYVSFLGRNQYDNTEQFPSLLLKELIQFLDNNFSYISTGSAEHSTDDLSTYLVTQHALQAFSADYFFGSSALLMNNYDEFKFNQAKVLHASSQFNESIFSQFDVPLSNAVSLSIGSITLAQLVRGLNNPSLALLRQQGVFLSEDELDDTDTELFNNNALTDYQLRHFRFSQNTESKNTSDDLTAFIRKGLLPQAEIGRQALSSIDSEVAQQKALLSAHYLDSFPDAYDFELSLSIDDETVQLVCSIEQMNMSKGQVLALSCTKLRGRHLLKAYLTHLCINLHAAQHQEQGSTLSKSISTYILSLEKVYKFNDVEPEFAQAELHKYCQYFKAFSSHASLFFVGSSFSYLSKLEKGEEIAEKECRISLFGTDRSRGEIMDEYHQYVFRNNELPIDKVLEQAVELLQIPFDLLEVMEESSQ